VDINNIGTVLELMSDAKVLNSRIRNGRTCIRAFGRKLADGVNPVVDRFAELSRSQVAQERINPVISNCIIQQAREFLLKVGANRALKCDNNVISPQLGNYALPNANNSNMDDSTFYAKYVITDITLQDTVFETSGLFCIGIETHFSGPFLNNAVSPDDNLWNIPPFNGEFNKLPMKDYVLNMLKNEGWENLAATSYVSKITLNRNVEFLDWKIRDNIDSSTLIDAESFEFLNLRVNEMVERASNNDESLKVLFDNGYDELKGEDVVVLHGGICFYGGGKNYSEVIGTNSDLKTFNVNLSILAKGLSPDKFETENDETAFQQGTFLPYAAGTEDFRFMMYTKDGGHNYAAVQKIDSASIVQTAPANPASYVSK